MTASDDRSFNPRREEWERGREGEREKFCFDVNSTSPPHPLSPSPTPTVFMLIVVLVSIAAPVRPISARDRPWVGVSSCSAQPCHGDVTRDNVWPIWGNEVTVWLERDPHAQAYRVLSNDLSKNMAERLRLAKPANRSELCLSCHSPGDAAAATSSEPLLADGVGCESCHGPARKWLTQHTLADWKNRSREAKSELGMLDTKSLYDRTKACAACHVGTSPADDLPGGDVTHDLIAAGHPALKFEFTAYLAKMPRHWTEKSTGEGFDARAWAVGQAASASAAMRLLASRATDRETSWPEFAEFDCYSCHHQLYGSRKVHDEEPQSAISGLPAWGTWYLSMASVFDEDARNAKLLAEIRRLMQHPTSDRKKVAQAADQAARQFDGLADRLTTESYSPTAVLRMLDRLKDVAPQVAGSHWDGQAQLYLALVAMHYARHDFQGRPPPDDALTRSLRRTREDLMFPTLANGDRLRQFDSPRGLDMEATLRARLLPEIERLLKE